MQIKTTNDIGKYSGVQFLHNKESPAQMFDITTKLSHRLQSWSNKFLSFVGRLTLARSTLTAMPIYAMQTMSLPKKLCAEIDKVVRRFVWSGTEASHRISLVGWHTLTTRRDKGGADIKAAVDFNQALMLKNAWEYFVNKDTRVKALQAKYGPEFSKHRNRMSQTARTIMDLALLIKNNTRKCILDGRNTAFWLD